MASTTAATLIERIAEALWPRTSARPFSKLTATGGGTASFISTSGIYSSGHANAYDHAYILILTDAGGASAAPEGETSQVTRGGYAPATGNWTVSPVYTAGVASGDVGLFLYGLHTDELYEAINDVQRTLAIPRVLPLTLVTGGNMEGVIGDFTDVGTPSTKEMVTTAAHTLLRQAMHLAGNSGVGKTTANIPVHETETLLVSVPIKCISGSVTVTLYNVTGSAAIRSVTVDEADYSEVRFHDSVPAGCKNVTVRILAAQASSEWYVGWISVLYQNRMVYNLPSALTDASEVEDVLHLPAYYSGDTSDTYLPLQNRLEHWPWYEFPRDWRGANPNRIAIKEALTNPIFLMFRTPASTLTALTSTTVAPEEVVVQGALAFIYRKMLSTTKDENSRKMLATKALEASNRYHHLLAVHDLTRPKPKLEAVMERVNVPW